MEATATQTPINHSDTLTPEERHFIRNNLPEDGITTIARYTGLSGNEVRQVLSGKKEDKYVILHAMLLIEHHHKKSPVLLYSLQYKIGRKAPTQGADVRQNASMIELNAYTERQKEHYKRRLETIDIGLNAVLTEAEKQLLWHEKQLIKELLNTFNQAVKELVISETES